MLVSKKPTKMQLALLLTIAQAKDARAIWNSADSVWIVWLVAGIRQDLNTRVWRNCKIAGWLQMRRVTDHVTWLTEAGSIIVREFANRQTG